MGSIDEIVSNEKVRYSRAGDIFHYRWAARLCLKMLQPLSPIKSIVIEGSRDYEMSGEYIIDVAEYYGFNDESGGVNYYQLKHTTVKKDTPFNVSDLKDTIIGFAKRYKDHASKKENKNVDYYIVTNRKISEVFKDGIEKLKNNKECDIRFFNTFKKYTELENDLLNDFCKHIKFLDGAGDYKDQWYDLYYETAKLIAGDIGHPQIDTITALVSEKALPNSDGIIYPEDILKRFGCISKRDLYPAPIEFEKLDKPIIRDQYLEISKKIIKSTEPVIVHASGGVGKSVFAIVLKDLLPKESVVITYDCFGLGKYRNRTQTRHRYRDGIVQLANELAGKGLCDPLIAFPTALDDDILRRFLEKLQIAVTNIRNGQESRELFIIIDAADNAEMAAAEFGDNCFIHELLREELPKYCHLVMLCRTERIKLLEPSSLVSKIELLPFDKNETLNNLKKHFNEVTEEEGIEFHRLTDGNPRVQANAIAFGNGQLYKSIEQLGPKGSTVENQIEFQLDKAIEKIKNRLTKDYQSQIEDICCGLASLPPFIPISVLSVAANVEESTVRSFISDLGRPIWITDSVVQFRDEPTETWFRKRFFGTVDKIRQYISRLKPLASKFTYIAEVLPILYLQGEYYKELIELALSGECLPEENPIDRRNVQMFRLQFAFKAALKSKQCHDASKIAMLAGEETAGNKRQLEIFKENTDLIAPLQDTQKVQELAFKRSINGNWKGSENLYSASLLSTITEYQGESRAYLRATEHWLKIYFEEKRKETDRIVSLNSLRVEEIVEIVFTHYNLNGIRNAVKYITIWEPEQVVFEISSIFSKKLIDLGRFNHIHEMSIVSMNNIYVILAINNELLKVGHFIDKSILDNCLSKLDIDNLKMPNFEEVFNNENKLESILSFAEMCIANCLNIEKIIKILKKFIPTKAPISLAGNYRKDSRNIFTRAVALRRYLKLYSTGKEKEWLPEKYTTEKKTYNYEQDIKELEEVFDALIPLYEARLFILINNYNKTNNIIDKFSKKTKEILGRRFQKYDSLQYEISQVLIEIMLLDKKSLPEEVKAFYIESIKSCNTISIHSRIQALRGANRINSLSVIRDDLEESVFEAITKLDEDTETKARYFIELARATISVSKADASEYFNMAIEEVSRFGDELPSRWKAVSATAKRCSEEYNKENELSYRFIRCAELVGDNIVREKYWNREEALGLCTALSPASGLAAVSRWRERNIGCFEYLFPAVAITIGETGYLNSDATWALSAFIQDGSMLDLAKKCINNTKSEIVVNSILESLIKFYGMLDMTFFDWEKLVEFINQLGVESNKLSEIYRIRQKNQKFNSEKSLGESEHTYHEITENEKKDIFESLDLMTGADILKAISRFKNIPDWYHNKKEFWQTFFENISQDNIMEFMEMFIKMTSIDFYQIQDSLAYIPERWMKKPSFRKKWPLILRSFAKLHASKLLNSFLRREFFSSSKLNSDEIKSIKEGIIEGLANKENIDTSDEYFDFVVFIQEMITPLQAKSLLEFSLGRFESTIDDDFGDGEWRKWLIPDDKPEMNIAGFIWTALASPEASTRWNAVHCIKRLAEFGCINEIRSLLQWSEKNTADYFGTEKFPFYNLNAHLYLLIALERISLDKPEILLKYVDEFPKYVLGDISHALIRKIALNIIRNVEKAFPGIYDKELFNQLLLKEKSKFPLAVDNCSENLKINYCYNDNIEGQKKFYHGYDFDMYWFKPLGKIFGISEKEVGRLATNVIINEWKISYDGSYIQDPRYSLFDSREYERKTRYSYTDHPDIERYNFYLSYHAMFVVAVKLFEKMPIINRNSLDENNPWDEWIESKSLCRNDGFWLADCRGSVPIEEPRWFNSNKNKNWRTNISDLEFLDNLIMNDGKICVKGCWENRQDSYREDISVSSALVSKETAQALLSALITCNNSNDYKLPDYNEESNEYDIKPFVLIGWIKDDYERGGLDSLDPWAGDASYPNYEVGDTYRELLGLQMNALKNKWYNENSKKTQVVCENWSRILGEYGEKEIIKGKRMTATLDILKQLCKETGLNLMLEVQISRSFKKHRYSNYMEEDDKYMAPINKIYLLSEKGVLLDEKGSFEFGKDASK